MIISSSTIIIYISMCVCIAHTLYIYIYIYIYIYVYCNCVCCIFYMTERSRSRNSTTPKTPLSSRKLKCGRMYPNHANSRLSNLRPIKFCNRLNNTVLLPVGLNTTHCLNGMHLAMRCCMLHMTIITLDQELARWYVIEQNTAMTISCD